MERTANALHDASTTAQSFTVTVEQSAQAVSSAADTITEVRTGLGSLEAQLRAVSILGAQPLSGTADAVGRIDASLEGLDTRLDGIATGLDGNRDALAGNATSLGQLGDSVEAMATRLDSGVVEDSLAQIQMVIAVVLLLFTAWSAVPAVGALVAGHLVATRTRTVRRRADSTRRPDRASGCRAAGAASGRGVPPCWPDRPRRSPGSTGRRCPSPVDSSATR